MTLRKRGGREVEPEPEAEVGPESGAEPGPGSGKPAEPGSRSGKRAEPAGGHARARTETPAQGRRAEDGDGPAGSDPAGRDRAGSDPATADPAENRAAGDPRAEAPAAEAARTVGAKPGTRRPAPLLLAALALVLAAAVAAGLTGWSWYGAAHDGDTAFARTRDTVLASGEQAVQNMNTLDHADLDHGLDVWESSTTGDLHAQLVQGRADFEKQVRAAQTVSTAEVLSGAVTELDTRTGRARVMIALRITVRTPKAQPSVKESRLLGELTRTPAGWKLSALGQAPLGDDAAATATPQPSAGQ